MGLITFYLFIYFILFEVTLFIEMSTFILY